MPWPAWQLCTPEPNIVEDRTVRLFRRRRTPRVDVGTFTAPPIRPLPAVDQVVEEGALLTMWSVRMAVKNRLIISALREGNDFDLEELKAAARSEMLTQADENEETAKRLREEAEQEQRHAGSRPPTPLATGEVPASVKKRETEEHRRRPIVHDRLARVLRKEADDDAALTRIVDQARRDAWHEVSREFAKKIKPLGFVPENLDDYERMRAGRLRRLVSVDLAALQKQHMA